MKEKANDKHVVIGGVGLGTSRKASHEKKRERKRTAAAAASVAVVVAVVDCNRHANVMLMIYGIHMVVVPRQQLINVI